MKNKLKQTITTMMITSLLITSFPVNALTKTETVYSKLNSDGTVSSTVVNEQLSNTDKEDLLNDNSELTNIINLSNTSKYTINGKNLVWSAAGKDILYQGTISKTLPVTVSATYKLDGKEMSVQDMLGKSGKVTITLKYKNNEKHKVSGDTLYTPFVVTMVTSISSTNNSNIKIDNGRVVTSGNINMVLGIASPGLYESLDLDELKDFDTITITYDTTKFELASIYSVYEPKLIDSSDLDIFDDLDSLYSNVKTLQAGMNQIESGADKLKEGTSTLKTSLGEAITKLKGNTGDALTIEQVNAIKKQAVSGVESKFTNEYKNAIASSAWSSTKESLDNSTDTTVSSYVESAVTTLLASYLGGQTNLQYYGGCLQGNEMACMALNQAGYDLETVNNYKAALITNISGVASKSTYYVAENVAKSVAVSVAESAAKETASSVSSTVASSVANQVKEASIKSVTSSLSELYDGVSQIDEGAGTLSDGITKLNTNGIKKITNTINNKVKPLTTKTEKLLDLSNDYQAYASNNADNVRFISLIDSQKVKEEKKVTTTTETKTTFLDRLKNLFK